MNISRELAIRVLKYLDGHYNFYFPFFVMCREYSDEDDNYVEIEPDEWKTIEVDEKYQTFQLWENLQNLDADTVRLMSAGFIQEMTSASLEMHIQTLVRNYRNAWSEQLREDTSIEDFGLNEFIEGKFRGYEDCLDLIKFYKS